MLQKHFVAFHGNQPTCYFEIRGLNLSLAFGANDMSAPTEPKPFVLFFGLSFFLGSFPPAQLWQRINENEQHCRSQSEENER